MIRAFIALAVPDDTAERLWLARRGAPGRVVARENFHLTLMFLGEVAEPALEDVHLELQAVSAAPVTVTVTGAGAFGATPRAIYAAVADTPELSHLQAKIAQAARRAGLNIEKRRFVPHITLTRLRASDADAARRYLAGVSALQAAPFTARAFTLFQSTLTPKGPVYEALTRYPLD